MSWFLLMLACQPWSDVDLDGDGARAGPDCDDADPRVHPGAPDPIGDELDANCDGLDGVDDDGDGFAAGSEPGQDCDDTDPEVKPGAVEVCNGVEDDCVGQADENAVDAPTWWADEDGDGWGASEGPSAKACAVPVGSWTQVEGDCEDHDPAVNPGAEPICGFDLDCSGAVACAPLEGELTGGLRFDGSIPGGAAGWSVAAVGDVDGDGWEDVAVGADELGVAWVLGGPFGSGGPIESKAVITLVGSPESGAGVSVAAVGRTGGTLDPYTDLLVGADRDDVGGFDAGAAWLVHGGPSTGATFTSAGLLLVGEDPGDKAGHAVAGPGDADGDGHDDLLVGAPFHGLGGAAYLVSGAIASDLNLGGSDLKLEGAIPGAKAGWWVGGGDLDGTGPADMVVGGPAADGGRVWVVLGSGSGVSQGTVSLAGAEWEISGVADGDQLGWSGAVGDVDGDGTDDLWVSARGADGERGQTWLVLGGPVAPGSVAVDQVARASISGLLPGERLGDALAIVPDQDGDGRAELLVAGMGAETTTEKDGQVWLFRGPVSGSLDPGEAAAWIGGTQSWDALGGGLSAGDLNKDGRGDLIVGAPGAGSDGPGVGSVFLFYGG